MGFWISPKGRIIQNSDHFQCVQGHPKVFGWTKAEMDKMEYADRDKVLAETISRGWIRVRGTRPNLSIEIFELNGNTISNIKSFLQKENIGPNEQIMFEEVAQKHGTWYEPASWVLDDEALKVARNPRKVGRR